MHDTGCLGLVHWDDPEGWYGEGGGGREGRGRWEEGSGWGTHVYLWQIHFDIWQNQYNIVKLNKIKFKKKERKGCGYKLVTLGCTRECLPPEPQHLNPVLGLWGR